MVKRAAWGVALVVLILLAAGYWLLEESEAPAHRTAPRQATIRIDPASAKSEDDPSMSMRVLAETPTDPAPHDTKLTAAATLTAEVIDSNGRRVPGALVEQFEIPADGPTDGSQRTPHASSTSGPDGTATFDRLEGGQVLIASRGHERSVPWQGTARERVVLTLRPTFELSGSISIPARGSGEIDEAPRLTFAAQDRNLWRTLHVLPQVASGGFGPIELPCMDVDRFRVRLEGGALVPTEAFLDPPPPGARRTVSLTTDLGVRVNFRVDDEEKAPIEGAVVKVKWQSPDRPDHWNQTEARTDATGYVAVAGVPSGTMMYEARATGYVSLYSLLVPTAPGENSFVRLTLEPAGRLTGRCTRGGAPVQDFEILVWKEVGTIPQAHPFLDREDGRFEINSVPLGTFWVTANTPDHPGGDPVSVICPTGGTAEVEIDLPELLIGRGRVVDEGTKAPLADASIQVFVPASPIPIARWGLPIPCEPDGSFQILGFLPGTNPLRALAPGYSNRIATTEAVNGSVDFGTIALNHSQSLTVVLERSNPSTTVQVSGRGVQILDPRTFTDGDTVVYENVSAGYYYLRFARSDYEFTNVDVDLVPGPDWVVRHRTDGARRLSVECRLPDGRPYPERFQLGASYASAQGHRHQRWSLSEDGVARVEGIDAARVSAVVLDWDGNEIAAGGGVFTGDEMHLVVTLDEDPLQVLVVGGDGDPLSDVRVMVSDPQVPGMTLMGSTNETGECRLVGVPAHEVRVDLQHSTGSRFGVPVDASTRRVELELDPSARIQVRLRDGDVPLEGVLVTVTDDTRASLTVDVFSNATGLATIPSLGPGPYLVQATRADCWRVEATVEARDEGEPTALQMRRLADLTLQLVTAEGLPVPDVPVSLESMEFGASVARWIAEERVAATDLRSDSRGQVRVERIPGGEYRWSLDLSGKSLEGRVVAILGADEPVLISLHE